MYAHTHTHPYNRSHEHSLAVSVGNRGAATSEAKNTIKTLYSSKPVMLRLQNICFHINNTYTRSVAVSPKQNKKESGKVKAKPSWKKGMGAKTYTRRTVFNFRNFHETIKID